MSRFSAEHLSTHFTFPLVSLPSFKPINKHDIITGACPTCASRLRCTGLVGCHGYPPLTCRKAPWASLDGGGCWEGGRLSPRPLQRSDWPRTGSRSQRAPNPTLWDGDRGQRPGHAKDARSTITHTCTLKHTQTGLRGRLRKLQLEQYTVRK